MESADKQAPNNELVPAAVNDPNRKATDEEINKLAIQFKGFDFLGDNKSLLGMPLATYPAEVERRIAALKKIQVEMLNTECKFFEELHQLEVKYAALHKDNSAKRSEIIRGKYEPSEEESDFKVIGAEAKVENKQSQTDLGTEKIGGDSPAVPVSGIPKFWLTILQNVDHFADMIETCDEPILEHLEDIQIEMSKEPVGFKLMFHFSPNEYFTNAVLSKTYRIRIQVDPKNPFAFEGPEIYKSSGCKINWKEGKDVTVREVKKKQKHKSTGAIRMTSTKEPRSSFFNFFTPPQVDEDDEDIDPDLQDKVTDDFELGSFLKERIIPRAVLYFTGEALVSDDEDDEDDDYSDDTEGEEGTDRDSGNERPEDDSATENEGEEEK